MCWIIPGGHMATRRPAADAIGAEVPGNSPNSSARQRFARRHPRSRSTCPRIATQPSCVDAGTRQINLHSLIRHAPLSAPSTRCCFQATIRIPADRRLRRPRRLPLHRRLVRRRAGGHRFTDQNRPFISRPRVTRRRAAVDFASINGVIEASSRRTWRRGFADFRGEKARRRPMLCATEARQAQQLFMGGLSVRVLVHFER